MIPPMLEKNGGHILIEEKKIEKRRELIGVCLDCFIEKGLTAATTKDLCTSAQLQNGGIYYYFTSKEEIVLACAEEAINRIEQTALDVVFEDLNDIRHMMEHLGSMADQMSPTMRFLVSVCVSREYGKKVTRWMSAANASTCACCHWAGRIRRKRCEKWRAWCKTSAARNFFRSDNKVAR